MIENIIDYKGSKTKLIWQQLKTIENIEPIRQVYALCFTKEGKILIIRNPSENEEEAFWCLPGGTPEKGETPKKALVRELDEEADISVSNTKLLGAQKVVFFG